MLQQGQLTPQDLVDATWRHCEFSNQTCWLQAIATRLEAIATRLEAIALRLEAIALRLVGWRPSHSRTCAKSFHPGAEALKEKNQQKAELI